MKYRELLINSQLAVIVWGIHGSLLSLFIAAMALETIGSLVDEEDIFFARATLIAQI